MSKLVKIMIIFVIAILFFFGNCYAIDLNLTENSSTSNTSTTNSSVDNNTLPAGSYARSKKVVW